MYHSLPIQSCRDLLNSASPFVLLDTAHPDADNIHSFLFLNPQGSVSAQQPDEVSSLLRQIDAVRNKFWMAGYLAYEAGFVFEEKLALSSLPLLKAPDASLGWFGIFQEPYIFNHTTGLWNRPITKLSKSFDAGHKKKSVKSVLQHSLSAANYAQAVQSIKRLIARGHTYQINFTYDVLFTSPQPAFDLYCLLRKNQAAAYCAFIKTDRECILSFSPELFFKKKGRHINVKPMKGTAGRGRFFEEDVAIRQALSEDIKNRSENVMIVDLMRNDLGKICETGSVHVKRLFETETLRTLHQMTSTITGKLQQSMTYEGIFRSLFPSGSVTGAPKIRSMEIIKSLEKGRRGVYCGAIGYISPEDHAAFSVPIRTLQKSGLAAGLWKYRVGSGIVWDSKASEEWQECATKSDFLTLSPLPDFELFESILWNSGLLYAKDHGDRLKRSAQYFFFPFDRKRFIRILADIKKIMRGSKPHKIRIFLDKNGQFRWDKQVFGDVTISGPASAYLSHEPIDENNSFLFNKTTYKPWYEKDGITIRQKKCFDIIHINSKGNLTEGSRCNVFIRKGKMLFTPSVECGLLPGVLRKNLLRRGKCKEAVLTPEDMEKADAVYCGNSVRGLVKVEIIKNKEIF